MYRLVIFTLILRVAIDVRFCRLRLSTTILLSRSHFNIQAIIHLAEILIEQLLRRGSTCGRRYFRIINFLARFQTFL